MRSSNPILTREGSFSVPAAGMRTYAPVAQGVTMESVVVRSASLLGTLILGAGASWVLDIPLGIAVVAGLVAFVIALVASFKRATSPALFIAYAGLEGILIGSFSKFYESAYSGIVIQAVLGVVMVFAAMLFLYSSKIVRATNRFAKIVLGAGIAYVLLMLVNFISSFFITGGLGLRDGGPLAIAFSIGAVVIGACFYVLDFDQAERLIAAGAPEKESWRVAFGLTLTTVWIYLEIMRLLSYFRN